MSTAAKELHKARPRLRLVSPLTFWTIIVFLIFNLTVGISFIVGFDQYRLSSPLLIVNNALDYRFWGILFILLGMIHTVSLWTNRWPLVRSALLVNVAINATWAIALIVRVAIGSGTLLISVLWAALALIQICVFVFFLPPLPGFGVRADRTDQEIKDGRQ